MNKITTTINIDDPVGGHQKTTLSTGSLSGFQSSTGALKSTELGSTW